MDESKLSPALGTKHALPVEVARFGWKSQERFLGVARRKAGAAARAPTGRPYETDQGNWILDCAFGPIADARSPSPRRLAGPRRASSSTGLFCGIATEVIVAAADGIRELKRP